MSMRRAVFFDLDDTLCDAATAFAAGRAAALAEARARAPELTKQVLADAWAHTQVDFFAQLEDHSLKIADAHEQRFRRMLALAGAPDDVLADRLKEVFGETQLAHLHVFDDVAAIAALRARGLFVGVITNGADDAATHSQRSKASHLGLLDELDGFWVSDTMGYRKPDPRAFAPALAAVGGAPAESIYVGDSPGNDIAGANAAGLCSVLLVRTPAEQPREPERARQPWQVVRSLWQTLALLDME